MSESGSAVDPLSPPVSKRRLRDSTTLKLIVLAVLLLILWIPLALAQGLVREREQRRAQVLQEIGGAWGQAQTLVAPLVSFRYVCDPSQIPPGSSLSCKGQPVSDHRVMIEDARWSVSLDPEVRRRSLYEAVVWQGEIQFEGVVPSAPSRVQRYGLPYRLTTARLLVGYTDPVGLLDGASLAWRGQKRPLTPQNSGSTLPQSALAAALEIDSEATATDPRELSFTLQLRGTERLWIVPSSSSTEIEISSSWPSPSFSGVRIPIGHSIDQHGFSARWLIAGDSHPIPSDWWDSDYTLSSMLYYGAGVDLVEPVDGYTLTTRATKYGLLFLVLTFTTFFLLEVTSSVRLHPIQYLLVGAALCLFYLLLLSLTEHIGFALSYLIASAATISTIALYSAAISRTRRWGLTMAGGLSILYLYLYVLLELEDFALLMGSVGLFLVLVIIMWLTRHLDWYHLEFRPGDPNRSRRDSIRTDSTSGLA